MVNTLEEKITSIMTIINEIETIHGSTSLSSSSALSTTPSITRKSTEIRKNSQIMLPLK